MKRFKSVLQSLIVAVLATALVVLLRRFVLIPVFEVNAPVMPFLLAVMAAASISGIGAGLFATVIGAATGFYLRGLQIPSSDSQLRLLLFVAIGGLMSWTLGSLRSARLRIAERQQQLEQEVRERQNAEAAEREHRQRLATEMLRREEAEWALREREERIRMAVESTNIGTFDFNPITGLRNWSDRAKIMFGLSPDTDVTNVSFLERVHPEDRERARRAVEKALEPEGDGKYDIDLRLVLPDGSIHWFIAKGQAFFEGEPPNRRAIRFIGTVFEVTDRKVAENALRASEGRLDAIVNNASAVIYLKNRQGQFLMVNRRFEELFKITQQEILGKTDSDVFPSDVVERLQANDRQVQETGQPLEFEEVVPHADGLHTYLSVKFPILDDAGECIAVGGISTDISDRKAVEDVVRASEIRLRGILDHMPAAISLKDLEGRYVLVNRGFEDLLGVGNNQIAGLTNYELIPKARFNQMPMKLADQFVRIDRKVIQTGELVTFEDSMPSGDDPRLFTTVKFPIKDASGRITGVGGISLDVTERRKALDSLAAEQEMLRHTIEVQDHERQLVAYEIHDGLVQYATGALMRLQALQDQMDSEPIAEEIRDIVGILQHTVDEGRRLIDGIRTPILDDFGIVAAVEQLIDEEERAHVQIEFVKDKELRHLDSNIEETLYRIAQEALTNIRKHSQTKKVRVELGQQGDHVHLEVQDWGVGFTPSQSRECGHGLLGMTKRAQMVGGRCKIASAPGQGTRIAVDLPYEGRKPK